MSHRISLRALRAPISHGTPLRAFRFQRAPSLSSARSFSQASFDEDMASAYMNFFNTAAPIWANTVSIVKGVAPNAKTILDLGSGPGEPACSVAAAYPEAKVTCTDIAPPMVEMAKERIKEQGLDVDTAIVDINDLSAFGDNSMDVITIQFGLMFTETLAQALSEMHRVVKPGGCVVGTVWNEFEMMPLLANTMKGLLGKTPPAPPVNPLSLKDEAPLDAELKKCGFELITGHNKAFNHVMEFGPVVDDNIQTTMLIPVLPKLKEMQESGEFGDNVIGRAKAEAVRAATELGCVGDDGCLRFEKPVYRYIMFKKPE